MVVGLTWTEQDGPPGRELFQVLRLQDGMVVDMEDHSDRRRALRAVGAPV